LESRIATASTATVTSTQSPVLPLRVLLRQTISKTLNG
jgi:hypothetical protein